MFLKSLLIWLHQNSGWIMCNKIIATLVKVIFWTIFYCGSFKSKSAWQYYKAKAFLVRIFSKALVDLQHDPQWNLILSTWHFTFSELFAIVFVSLVSSVSCSWQSCDYWWCSSCNGTILRPRNKLCKFNSVTKFD